MSWRSIKYDIKLLRGDPMLILSIMVPFILWTLMKFVFPLLEALLIDKFAYDIGQWYRQVGYFFMLLIPMMTGMVYGFIMVDERDEGIITAISVTPAGKPGYLRNRLGLPLLLSFIFLLLFCYLLRLQGSKSPFEIIILAALIASQALFILLVLGAFADNKIMGLALSKGFGILLLGPVLDFVLPGPIKWLGAFSPMFWTGRAFLTEEAHWRWIYILAAFVIHIILIFILYKRFLKRSD